MRLVKLEIELVQYGEDKGQYKGVARFDGSTGSIALKLNQHHCEQMFLTCAEGIVDVAKAAAKMFVAEAMGTIEAVKTKQLSTV